METMSQLLWTVIKKTTDSLEQIKVVIKLEMTSTMQVVFGEELNRASNRSCQEQDRTAMVHA